MKLVGGEEIDKAIEALRRDEVVVLPTETVYGFFCNAFSKEPVERIFKIKKRSFDEPIGIFVSSLKEAKKLAFLKERGEEFFKKYLPGPVTLIFQKKTEFPKGVGTENTIGIRVPDFSLFEKVFRKIDFPLAQTSANISGEETPAKGEEIFLQFKKRSLRPDLVLEGETKSGGKPSTVVDLTSSVPRLVRKGSVDIDI